jgi:hypothetical protein
MSVPLFPRQPQPIGDPPRPKPTLVLGMCSTLDTDLQAIVHQQVLKEVQAFQRLRAIEEAARQVVETWGEEWDCSRSPGHEGMRRVIDALVKALGGQ